MIVRDLEFVFLVSLFSFIYNEVLYRPLFNGLVLIYQYLPAPDIGLAIIVFTVIIRFLMYPLTHKSLVAQKKMAAIQPKLKEIQARFKDNKEEQTRKIMELYKEHDTNPFSGCMLMILQIPVFIVLFQIFKSGFYPESFSNLYSFVERPENINALFLGAVNLTLPNPFFAIIVGLSQFLQLRLVPEPKDNNSGHPTLAGEIGKSMQKQMKYVLPFVIGVAAWSFPAALALHWTISNVFAIFQQMIINKKGN